MGQRQLDAQLAALSSAIIAKHPCSIPLLPCLPLPTLLRGSNQTCHLTPVHFLQVMEVDVDMLTCQVTEGLTEDAVSARLHQGGLVPPLYLHSSIHTRQDSRVSESTVEAEWEQRVSQLFRSQVCFPLHCPSRS